ncbi:regulator of protease activity HflC (stomatin/prohibitin superfamily) [Algoriphagus ratkowskyi]|uniref:Prohibitin family protein n=1 Tax=Algoriphagus ratkowskyi TaxID=57028 RepID=A0A2W7R7X8_9BACT|nr:prohibitin family protein [Algoriphagus ratkowskyi]PZX56953.1 regulator of protease activity HflC (stomatin/prohibitin superfamily) [Algoriphagus ratkowskyi]TXD79864.1 prohibitin family protein [Algoriphagus ratkowskyi]
MNDQNMSDIKSVWDNAPMRNLIIVGVLVIVLFILKPWVQVGAGERGIVQNFGAVQDKVLSEGIHFKLPIVQTVILMDVKIQKAMTDAASSSSDLQDVDMSVALNYHIMPNEANLVYQRIGLQFKERIIDPAIQEVMKAVSARYTAEELITKRPAVSSEMKDELTARLLESNIGVDAFSIISFSFSQTFTDAIEAKQTAEQNALKAKRDLDRIKVEAEQTIAAATAEAEALRLQKMNISPDLIELRKIEANLKAIEKWNGILPEVTGAGAIPFIGVGEVGKN